MDPVVTPLLALVLGNLAREVITEACKGYLVDKAKSVFGWIEQLGEGDKLELAYQDALEQASGVCLDTLLQNIKGAGYTDEELKEYRDSLKAFIKDKQVLAELLESLRDLNDKARPSPEVLRERWEAVSGQELPDEMVWNSVVAAFRRRAIKQSILSDELRELLNAQTMQEVKQLLERQGGVKVQVRKDRYALRMRTRFAPVDLANLMPAHAEDPGQMVIREVFVAQKVRENPPPIEFPKDLAARLRKREDPESDDDIDATLDAQRFEQLHTTYVKQPPRSVLDVIAEKNNRLLVLMGEPGSGKSTLLRYLLTGIIEPSIDQQTGEPLTWTNAFKEAFPLLIELRDFYAQRQRDECDTFLEYVAYMGKTDQWFLDDHAVHDYLENGPSLVMFDGLDEIFDLADRERVMHEIAGFAQRYPHTRIIVTSRPVGYREQILRNAGFAHFGMQDLDDEQIETFIRGWFALTFPQQRQQADQRIERVLDSVKQSKSIRLLAGNPMLLTIMALLAREEELPRERVKFYEKAVEVLCHHWDANRNLHLPEERYLNADDKKALLRRIAIRMQTGAGGLSGNVIQQEDLGEEIQHYLIDAQWQPNPAEAKQAARRMIGQLRERNYILCLRGPNLYGFVHRTFLEYLTATEYVHRFDRQPQRMTFGELLELFDQHCRDDDWREVLRLICGQIDEQFVGQIVEHLATRTNLGQWDGKTPLPELPLAIWCLGEVRNVTRLGISSLKVLDRVTELIYKVEPAQPYYRIGTAHVQTRLADYLHANLLFSLSESSAQWPQIEHWVEQKLLSRSEIKDDGQYIWPEFLAIVTDKSPVARTVTNKYLQHDHILARKSAIHCLLTYWPDAETRALLEKVALYDKESSLRCAGLKALADKWPDATTQALLIQYALEDEERVRLTALELLAEKWSDHSTHTILANYAISDPREDIRSTMLWTLANTWPTEDTRTLLVRQIGDDPHEDCRRTIIEALATKWPDESTRSLLIQCSVHDNHPWPRQSALQELVDKWPDATTRELLAQRVIHDEDAWPRQTALQLLVETWPDGENYELLTHHVLYNSHEDIRCLALEILVRDWPNTMTRSFLTEHIIHDENSYLRRTALEILVVMWPDEDTQSLLTQYKTVDGIAASQVGGQHSEFGLIVFTAYLDGKAPYLDPTKPIPRYHFKQAVKKINISGQQIDELVQSLSEHMGWDITKGSAG